MWKCLGVLTLLTLSLTTTPVMADTGADVTVTATGHVEGAPGAPSGLTLTYVNDYEVGISWTKGEGAVNTMVRAKLGSVPESRSDGYLVYYGEDTNCSDTAVSLDDPDESLIDDTSETPFIVYYIAWSQNAGGSWEEDGVSNFLEGFGMTTVAVALIVLVFTLLAFWKRDAVLYMLGVIGWLFMTFYLVNRDYPEENAYLPFAMAGFCLSITLVMAIQAIRVYYSDRTTPPTSNDIQAAHKKKVIGLTKRQTKKWYE